MNERNHACNIINTPKSHTSIFHLVLITNTLLFSFLVMTGCGRDDIASDIKPNDTVLAKLKGSDIEKPYAHLNIPRHYFLNKFAARNAMKDSGPSIIALEFMYPQMDGYSKKYKREFNNKIEPSHNKKVRLLFMPLRHKGFDAGSNRLKTMIKYDRLEKQTTSKVHGLIEYKGTEMDTAIFSFKDKENNVVYIDCHTQLAQVCRAFKSYAGLNVEYQFFMGALLKDVKDLDARINILINSFSPKIAR